MPKHLMDRAEMVIPALPPLNGEIRPSAFTQGHSRNKEMMTTKKIEEI
jgi:hypothetical protein